MIDTRARFERHDHPFPYYAVESVISPADIKRLNADLPPRDLFNREVKEGTQHRKQYRMWRLGLYENGARTLGAAKLPGPWTELLDSLLSPEFTAFAGAGLDMDLRDLRLTLGLYRYAEPDYTTVDTGKLGKAVHWALYLNETWTEADGGAMHLWTAKDADRPAVAVTPRGGTSAIFRPGPVTWHNIDKITSGGRYDRINIMVEYWTT